MNRAVASENCALLLGYGSVGRTHARLLAEMSPALMIVDTKDEARARARSEHPSALVVDRLEALDGDSVPWSSTLAVIATWGPSHAGLFDALVDRGVRHILCEKPLATSVERAEAMVQRAARDGVFLASHHYLRYSGFVPAFLRLAGEHRLGEPVAILAAGGACCLVTTGIHWVDLAIEVFGARPVGVMSTAHREDINPRSPDLGHYGGSAIWTFSRGRELILTLSRHSSVYPLIHVYFRHAVATIDARHEITLYRRDLAAVEKFPAITRTGSASELLFRGRLPEVLDWDEALGLGLRELREGKADLCPGHAAAAAVNAAIGALIAGREGWAVDLPIDPESDWGREAWPIT